MSIVLPGEVRTRSITGRRNSGINKCCGSWSVYLNSASLLLGVRNRGLGWLGRGVHASPQGVHTQGRKGNAEPGLGEPGLVRSECQGFRASGGEEFFKSLGTWLFKMKDFSAAILQEEPVLSCSDCFI